ncbi:hypothetical protein CBF30_06675 [Vagococcus entomophilus]|uniref:DUF2187 domain-containing protein n=2 Tax=Vagococcus entomophilus TaxID=1160095 RepID=A0A430AHK9_9ENTE|nr:hypothetical protein CBF30_06675 [Vagococcus entomophilus]
MNDSNPTPSETGRLFAPGTHVTFNLHGSIESGTITKQLTNAAIVHIDACSSNKELIFNTNGQTVINYHRLKLTCS